MREKKNCFLHFALSEYFFYFDTGSWSRFWFSRNRSYSSWEKFWEKTSRKYPLVFLFAVFYCFPFWQNNVNISREVIKINAPLPLKMSKKVRFQRCRFSPRAFVKILDIHLFLSRAIPTNFSTNSFMWQWRWWVILIVCPHVLIKIRKFCSIEHLIISYFLLL